MGTLLFILLVILVLSVLLGAGGYSVRRTWSPAGSEIVEVGDYASVGAGAGAAVLAMLVLVLLFLGFTRWNWFGTTSTGVQANPVVTTPQQGIQSPPVGASASPSGSPGSSPSAQPSPS